MNVSYYIPGISMLIRFVVGIVMSVPVRICIHVSNASYRISDIYIAIGATGSSATVVLIAGAVEANQIYRHRRFTRKIL